MRVTAYPASEWRRFAPVWRDLFWRVSGASIFLSVPWTETWLETYGPSLNPVILAFEDGNVIVGVCLLVESRARHGVVSMRRLSLNASGEAAGESTYIEYNDVLALPGWEAAVGEALGEYIGGSEWDEVALDGITAGPALAAVQRSLAGFGRYASVQPCYYVDLAKIRGTGSNYESALRGHYRKHLHRNIKSYSQRGALAIDRAANPNAAIAMFEELAVLNRRRWTASGHHSSFESARFVEFHRRLIQRSFAEGLIELIRVRTGATTIGILYNLCLGRKVYFYQCGYDYDGAGTLSPGIVVIAYAVQSALDSGMDDWDFLAGDTTFKRSLSTGVRQLGWVVFQKASWKAALLKTGRLARRKLDQFRRR